MYLHKNLHVLYFVVSLERKKLNNKSPFTFVICLKYRLQGLIIKARVDKRNAFEFNFGRYSSIYARIETEETESRVESTCGRE